MSLLGQSLNLLSSILTTESHEPCGLASNGSIATVSLNVVAIQTKLTQCRAVASDRDGQSVSHTRQPCLHSLSLARLERKSRFVSPLLLCIFTLETVASYTLNNLVLCPMGSTGFRNPWALSSAIATLGHYSPGPSGS